MDIGFHHNIKLRGFCASNPLAWWSVVANLHRTCNTSDSHLLCCLVCTLSRGTLGIDITVSSVDA
jgi:hypothetical protein